MQIGEKIEFRMLKIRDVLGPSRNILLNFTGRTIKKNGALSQSLNIVPLTTAASDKNVEILKLPVPPLSSTLEKFKTSVKPLLTDQEFETTKELISEFGSRGGVGETLQQHLEEHAKTKDNWLSDWWLNAAYLDFRYPVVIHSSPGLIFPTQKFSSKAEQLEYAAKVISGSLLYSNLIDTDQIPQEYMGKQPLDMSQFKKMLGTCRVPGLRRDRVRLIDRSDPPIHIIVAHKNHLFKVQVLEKISRKPLSQAQILAQLHCLVDTVKHKAIPIGILTTENRDNWGKAYKLLSDDVTNRFSLHQIHTALFMVCLDEHDGECGESLNEQTIAAKHMIHGAGSKCNSANRWYDLTVQFVIGSKGAVGLTFEHSPAEGPPAAHLMDFLINYIEKNKEKPSLASDFPIPERLVFIVSDDVKKMIETAESNVDKMVDDLQLACFTFKDFGKDFIKQQKLSPDSFIQMAIQLAFYRLHKTPGAHYESASLRKFIHGRTDTIRSCSTESIEFAKLILNKAAKVEDKAKALVAAINSHKKYTIDAVNGTGIDRHLLGLKLIALEKGIDVPKLYSDAGFVKSTHFRISTSQVAGKSNGFMSYAPLCVDGYACCYNPRDNEIIFGTSAFKTDTATDAYKFKEALQTSLMEMHDVLLQSSSKSKL